MEDDTAKDGISSKHAGWLAQMAASLARVMGLRASYSRGKRRKEAQILLGKYGNVRSRFLFPLALFPGPAHVVPASAGSPEPDSPCCCLACTHPTLCFEQAWLEWRQTDLFFSPILVDDEADIMTSARRDCAHHLSPHFILR